MGHVFLKLKSFPMLNDITLSFYARVDKGIRRVTRLAKVID